MRQYGSTVNGGPFHANEASMKTVLLIAMCLFLVGCEDWNAKAPPETQAGQHNIKAEPSYAQVSLSANTSEIATAIMQNQQGRPLFDGRTPEISAKLLIDKNIPAVFEDFIVTPYKAAGCVTERVLGDCVRNVTQRIGEDCIRNLRLDRCFRNIVVPVHYQCYRDVQRCWPEVKEVIESRIKVAAYVKEELLPTSVWVNYNGVLKSIHLEAHGKTLSAQANIQVSVSIDIKQGILDQSMTVKGALKCSSDFDLSVQATTVLLNDASLTLDITDFAIGLDRLCVPGAVELMDLALLDTSRLLQRELIKELMRKPLVDLLNRELRKSGSNKLGFKENLDDLARSLKKPLDLKNDAWLTVNPQRIIVSQLSGTGDGADNRININVAIEASPVVSLGPEPSAEGEASEFTFSVAESIPSGIHLVARGTAPLGVIRAAILKVVSEYLNENHADQPYTVGDVIVYQSGEKFVIGLIVVDRAKSAEQGRLYVWATPYLSADGRELRLRDVEFDVDSKSVLAKVGAWLLAGKLTEYIENKAQFSYGGELDKLQSSLANVEQDADFGVLKGRVDSISAKDIWIADNAINVIGEANGSASVVVKP